VALTRPSLTREGLEGLLARLHPDREQAAEAYERIRARLLKFFDYRGCGAAEQAADETIDRVARRLAEGESIRADDASPYFLGVARNVLREYWARPEGGWRSIDDVDAAELPAPPEAVPDEDDERRWRCLEKCLDGLAAGARELVLEYYEWGRRERIGSRKELGQRLGLSLNALRIRAHRIRASLERCVRDCASGGEMEAPAGPQASEDRHRG
jgi:DNA-directed RNA polymerase specialized sigma24 family protein